MALSIAVVTRRAGVTLTLRSKAHSLVEVRPTGEWMARPWPEDVVVLDLESLDATMTAVHHLRRSHPALPIVVIGSDDALATKLASDDVLAVPLPMTATTLLDTVDRAATRAGVRFPPAVEVATPAEGIVRASGASPQVIPGSTTASDRQLAATRQGQGHDMADEVLAPRQQMAASEHSVELVRALLARLAQLAHLPDVPGTAELARSRAIAAASADASVVLVPDGKFWRVAAGSGLRPLEQRLQIASHHWLVAEIALRSRGLLIRNTDIARTQLAGAPLASWPQLLAAPIGDSGAIALLARKEEPFTRAELTQVAGSLEHLSQQFADAIDTRQLARELIPYLDLEG